VSLKTASKWVYIAGSYLLAVAGLWAALGVLALLGETIPEQLEDLVAAMTGLAPLALLPFGLGLSRLLWDLDRKRVWRSLGDAAAIAMLGLVLAAAGFVLVDALNLLGTESDNDGVPNGNLVAIMVFVGAFALLAVLVISRRSPPPPIEEIALSDILGHAALARQAAGQADVQVATLEKQLASETKDRAEIIAATQRAADCARIAARCAGLAANQLMRAYIDLKFGRIIAFLGGRSRACVNAYWDARKKISENEPELRDRLDELAKTTKAHEKALKDHAAASSGEGNPKKRPVTKTPVDKTRKAMDKARTEVDDVIQLLRDQARRCSDRSAEAARAVEWAADEAYATVESGEPSGSPPPKDEKKDERKDEKGGDKEGTSTGSASTSGGTGGKTAGS
jgi:hypothetical protein